MSLSIFHQFQLIKGTQIALQSEHGCLFCQTFPPHDKQQFGCAPSEDSDQPGHPPRMIRVFAVRMKKAWVLSTY